MRINFSNEIYYVRKPSIGSMLGNNFTLLSTSQEEFESALLLNHNESAEIDNY